MTGAHGGYGRRSLKGKPEKNASVLVPAIQINVCVLENGLCGMNDREAINIVPSPDDLTR